MTTTIPSQTLAFSSRFQLPDSNGLKNRLFNAVRNVEINLSDIRRSREVKRLTSEFKVVQEGEFSLRKQGEKTLKGAARSQRAQKDDLTQRLFADIDEAKRSINLALASKECSLSAQERVHTEQVLNVLNVLDTFFKAENKLERLNFMSLLEFTEAGAFALVLIDSARTSLLEFSRSYITKAKKAFDPSSPLSCER